MRGIQVRKGSVLLWRLGQLSYGEQSQWDRAPEGKGMWAFPWPHYSSDFTNHQYDYYMPRRLQVNGWYDPLDLSWWEYRDGSKPDRVETDEYHIPLDPDLIVPEAFDLAREDWRERVGRKVLPLRKFWYEGEVLTHVPPKGLDFSAILNPTDYDSYWQAVSTWHRCDSIEAARRVSKDAAKLNFYSKRKGDGKHSYAGLFELFLPARKGKIS